MVAVEDIKNIAFVSQSNTGKSSLIANILATAKVVSKPPKKEDAHLVSDYTQEEKDRNFTHTIKIFTCPYDKFSLNLIDTPGYPDFIGEVFSGLAAVDGVVFVLDAAGSIEVQTEEIWNAVREKNLPNMVFINKMDRQEADYPKILNKLKQKLKAEFMPVQFPKLEGKILKGVESIVEEVKELPDEFSPWREKLVESAAETDDSLIEKYLENGKLSPEEIKKGLSAGIKKATISPVMFGSVYSEIGIDSLTQFLIDFFPNPMDRKVLDKEGKEIDITEGKEALAQVFKISAEPHLGEVAIFRVFSGKFNSSSSVQNVSKGIEEKFGQKFQILTGQTKKEVDSIGAGEIAGIAKLKSTEISDTLSSSKTAKPIKPIEFPSPNSSVAIVPKERKDEEKVSFALEKLSKEDPTLQVSSNKEFSEMVLSGMGELHLMAVSKRLSNKFGVNVEFKEPRVPYRETIKGKAKAQAKYKQQTGGHGQYADVWLEVEPLSRGGGFEFVNKIVGGRIPSRFIPSVEKGVKEALNKGINANYPVTDIKVTLYDGGFHPVDSSDIAFQIAGSLAFKDAVKQANPVLVEPIMEVEVTVPEEYVGDVTGDINSRRGRILNIETKGSLRAVKAQVPQGELHKYASTLKSITQGRGRFQFQFSCYEEVPSHIAKKISEEAEKKK